MLRLSVIANFVPSKTIFRGVLEYYFFQNKAAVEGHRIRVEIYGIHAVAEWTLQEMVSKNDFDLGYDNRLGAPKTFEYENLGVSLREEPCQTQEEHGDLLGVVVNG